MTPLDKARVFTYLDQLEALAEEITTKAAGGKLNEKDSKHLERKLQQIGDYKPKQLDRREE